jgi:hypothetical protein
MKIRWSSHFWIHDRQPLGHRQGAKSLVSTNELNRLTRFVQVDRYGQLKRIECSKILRQPDSTNQPFGRLKMSGSQSDHTQSARRNVAAEPSGQLLKINRSEFADTNLFGKDGMQFNNRQAGNTGLAPGNASSASTFAVPVSAW